MRKIILLTSTIIISTISAQVGINTNNPKGIFHINSAANAATLVADDVIVLPNGNVGLGTLSPTEKLHIEVAPGQPALRIEDGNQKEGNILLAKDGNGNATWGIVRGTGGYSRGFNTKQTFPHNIFSKAIFDTTGNTKIHISTEGKYLVYLRWWGYTDAIDANKNTSALVYLLKNGAVVDGIEQYVYIDLYNSPFTFTTALVAPFCNVGDYLEIGILPQVGGAWFINQKNTDMVASVTVLML